MIETRALLSQIMFKCWTSVMRFRFVALDLILMVEDVLPLHQDKNNASFSVITDGRVYELMARDEDEKER